jgi:hypothetical protein
MNRKEWRKQHALERRAQKAWEEAEQFGEDFLAECLKAADMSEEEASHLSDRVASEILQVLDYHKVPLILGRCILLSMLAKSLARHATDSDLAEDAARYGKTLVDCALELFDQNSSAH